MDELRARAYLDLLLGQDSRPRDPKAADTTGRDGSTTHQPPGAGPAGAAAGGFAGQVTLTVPLATAAGLADRPGELAGLTVDQLPDGTFRWTTPAGRGYDTEPTRYPI